MYITKFMFKVYTACGELDIAVTYLFGDSACVRVCVRACVLASVRVYTKCEPKSVVDLTTYSLMCYKCMFKYRLYLTDV